MYIPKISTKRVLGLVMASALAVTGTVTFASSSQAVSSVQVKLSPITGASTGGTIVTITGKNFQTDVGTAQIGTIRFGLVACSDTPAGTAATTISITSPTKVVVTTPALTVAKYFVCVFDVAGTLLVGSSTFTGVLPVSSLAITPASGPTLGGTKVVVSGDDFTAKTKATVGGKLITATKVVINAGATDDTLTGLLPAGSGADAKLVVTNEGGNVEVLAAVDYFDAVKVSPSAGAGALNDVINVTGSGFLAGTFSDTAATGVSQLALIQAPIAAAGTAPTTRMCGKVQVESDTQLNCQLLTTNTDGAYTLVLFKLATATTITNAATIARSANYTVSDY